MQNNINKNSFFNIDSLFHELHPMTKIICNILFILTIIFSKSLYLNLILIVLLIINVLLSNVPFKIYLKVFRRILILCLFVFLINYFLKVDIIKNLVIAIKIFEVIFYSCTLVLTTKPNLLVKSLGNLMKPFQLIGLPIYKIAFNLVYFVNMFLRMFDLNYNIKKVRKSCDKSIVPLFVISKSNSKSLKQTMKIKYYDVNNVSNVSMKIKWHFADTMLIILYLLILLLTIEQEVILCAI